MLIKDNNKKKLFRRAMSVLGADVVSVEVTDAMMEDYLEMAIEDISGMVNEHVISNNWMNLNGVAGNSRQDFLRAVSYPNLDLETRMASAFSRLVGLNAAGDWRDELKLGWIDVPAGSMQQTFEVPYEREIINVMYESNADSVKAGMFSFGGPAMGGAGLFDPAATFGGAYYAGTPMGAVLPLYGVLSQARFVNQMGDLFRSRLSYTITSGMSKDGNKVRRIHLMPAPNHPDSFNNRSGGSQGPRKVFYWYYERNRDEPSCSETDPAFAPYDISMDTVAYEELNEVFQVKVRDLFIAKTQQGVGRLRGKFSGSVGTEQVKLLMDYRMLLDEGKATEDRIRQEMKEYMQKFSPSLIMEEKAKMAESLNRTMQLVPTAAFVIK